MLHAAVAYFIASVPMLIALVLQRRRYRRLAQPLQWIFGSVAMLFTILAYLGLFAR